MRGEESEKQGIRAIALGLIQNGSRLFVSKGFDPVKQDTFYRALGGGDRSYVASWIERDRFQSGELRLVPPECLQYFE